jgi:phosphatidylglycerol:prolipoprotein diacylglycerol transferase
MYPVLFRVGSFDVTSFGVLVALAALFGLWLFRRELRLSGLPVEAGDVALIGALAGLAGAKLLWVLEHLGEEPATALLLSRAGMSWFGGFAGGLGAGLWTMKRRGWPILPVVSAAVPGLALGHAIGRIGCFLVGDDYGTPSNLPWAVAFPEGSPPTIERVHPTQLYEAAALIPIAGAMLGWRRRYVSDAWVVGAYLVSTGLLRFAIEFIRVNERVALGLTVAQWAALALSIAGAAFIFRAHAAGASVTTADRSGRKQHVRARG